MIHKRILAAALCIAGGLRGEVVGEGPATPAPPAVETVASEPSSAPETAAPDAPMPRPYRRRLQAAVAENARCASCHREQAAEWRGSLHRAAYTHKAFQTALTIEPTGFCRGCHAPESDPAREPPPAVADLGVGCVSCHVTEEGVVLAAASSDGSGSAGAPHPIRRSAAFAKSGGCAACHEFRFPLAHGDADGEHMQTTVREHGRSSSSARACADCHMPRSGGHRSHAFASVRDPGWLRDQLAASAERVDDHTVRITLAQPAPGHGFPTGDLFRRLEVGGEIRDAGGKVSARAARHLARHFVIEPGSPGRQLAGDDRVFDAPVAVDLELDRPGPVSWWVTYQRVATVGAGQSPADAKIESEVRLHEGTIP